MTSSIYYRLFIIIFIAISVPGCWNREKDNPFEPEGTFPISLDVLGYDGYVEISWGDPPVTGYSEFNIFRSETGTTGSFDLLTGEIPPSSRNYTDTHVANQKKYFYYITVTGVDVESKPSKIVSAVPGPGFHWVVDNYDYLIARLTYDCTRITRVYYTNYSPYQMIIGNDNIGLVLYTHLGLVESFSLENAEPIDQSTGIAHPYQACYDANNQCGWVIDTSGVLYRVDFPLLQVTSVSADLGHPRRVSVNTGSGTIAVVDRELRAVLMLNANGTIISRIDRINNVPLSEPVGFIDDEESRRMWLVDRKAEGDIVYTRGYEEDDFNEIDSFTQVTDIEAIPATGNVWILDYQGINSAIVQLSASGIRQITLSSIAYPLDIAVNRYGGTLLIANSGKGEVLHYALDNTLSGKYSNFYLPVNIISE